MSPSSKKKKGKKEGPVSPRAAAPSADGPEAFAPAPPPDLNSSEATSEASSEVMDSINPVIPAEEQGFAASEEHAVVDGPTPRYFIYSIDNIVKSHLFSPPHATEMWIVQ